MTSLTLLPTPTSEQREVLAETAAQAVGGGTVVGLVPLDGGRLWHATVLTAEGVMDVRLHTAVRTAVVVPRPDEARHREAA